MKASEIEAAAERIAGDVMAEGLVYGDIKEALRETCIEMARWALEQVREHLLLFIENDPANDDWCDKHVLYNAIKECICKIEEDK